MRNQNNNRQAAEKQTYAETASAKHGRGKVACAGTTLVEMVVSMLLVELLMVMVIGVISPAAKTFARMQQLQFAQLILDNVTGELQTQTADIVSGVKIYSDKTLATASDQGTVLEFMNTDGYVELVSSEGCDSTTLIRGVTEVGTASAISSGRLLVRYYWPAVNLSGDGYTYTYKKDGALTARSVNSVFPDGYYMGNYIKITFSYPKDAAGEVIAEEGKVPCIYAKVEVYQDPERTKLVTSEETVLDVRYTTKRLKGMTATALEY